MPRPSSQQCAYLRWFETGVAGRLRGRLMVGVAVVALVLDILVASLRWFLYATAPSVFGIALDDVRSCCRGASLKFWLVALPASLASLRLAAADPLLPRPDRPRRSNLRRCHGF